MEITHILVAIDAEIGRLQQAKAILNGFKGKRGPRTQATPKKRHLSPEARAKIAAAQRARWAKQKKATK
jgi:hypothetical protein